MYYFNFRMPSIYCAISTCWRSKRKQIGNLFTCEKYSFIPWVGEHLCKQTFKWRTYDPRKIYNNCKVCRHHFCDDDFSTNNRLKKNVVPHLNVPGNLLLYSVTFLVDFSKLIFFLFVGKITENVHDRPTPGKPERPVVLLFLEIKCI